MIGCFILTGLGSVIALGFALRYSLVSHSPRQAKANGTPGKAGTGAVAENGFMRDRKPAGSSTSGVGRTKQADGLAGRVEKHGSRLQVRSKRG